MVDRRSRIRNNMRRMWLLNAAAASDTPPATPFDPLSLFQSGTYKGFWLDASDLSTLKQDTGGTTAVTADGDPVGYVANKVTTTSGVFTRRTDDTCRPLYKVVSGYSCLQFDGSNDGIDGDATMRTITSGSQQYWTNVFVASLDSTGVTFNDMLFATEGSNFNVMYNQYISNTQMAGALANVYTWFATHTSTDKNVYVIKYRLDNTSPQAEAIVNNVSLDSGGASLSNLGAGNANYVSIGHLSGGSFFKGNLYQAYLINREVTGTDLSNLVTYMGAKAGLTL